MMMIKLLKDKLAGPENILNQMMLALTINCSILLCWMAYAIA